MNEHAKSAKPVTYSVTEARARLSELLARAAKGEDIHLTRNGKPYARISGEAPPEKPRRPKVGAFEGQFSLPDNWDEIPTGFETLT
ncbi:prevent-host-death family protein [Hoeflea marina]|uniref:Antitoxin n=1 Tax=Hoeflea marina TaxID=274592 RepID=A0A317PSM1_9HYPH|nr:type II toxin-antitoxin system prevent-host-death family antitoxin [Hoeflea marina]PWW04169.1 prevent-host-death family protein [Hoeflea marina]